LAVEQAGEAAMLDHVLVNDTVVAVDGRAETRTPAFEIAVTTDIDEIASAWQTLAAGTPAESPGQDFAFIRLWADTHDVPDVDRLFVVAKMEAKPLALLPLMRTRWLGLRLLTWFPGAHVGCSAPLVDAARLNRLNPGERAMLWRQMTSGLGADGLYLPAVPALGMFDELGASIVGDTLYRAQFQGWEEADKTQRNKSRRKHDRQQGDRLNALGHVTFSVLDGGAEHLPTLDTMFRQRAARFAAMGIADPFANAMVRAFYDATMLRGCKVKVRLHVLRLDGEIVAVRYNVVSGDRTFCLISSMSDDPRIQGGSPGKQCLLRVIQTEFENGTRCFDMGAGFTDEKRHWCNVQVALRQHYLPLTPLGHIAAAGHRAAQWARREIKSNPRLLTLAKRVRSILNRGGRPAPATEIAED
jgi:CelD/BcsL family acetyltransferase involved in cellulose biosynthesis